MQTHYETDTEPGVATLVGGIMQDVRELFVQQLTLFQTEIKHDVQRAIYAIAPMIFGAVLCVPAVLLLGMGCAFFLSWLVPELPLWGSFAIVGGTVALCSIGLVLSGRYLFEKVRILPEQSLQGLKENIQWKTKT